MHDPRIITPIPSDLLLAVDEYRFANRSPSVGPGAVARDDLDTWMLAEPRGQRVRLSIGQQLYDPIALQIDQNGSVAMPAAPPLVWLSIGCADGTFASLAQSSTASTRGVVAGLSPAVEAAIRSSVSALIGTATRAARRVPASPPRDSRDATHGNFASRDCAPTEMD